MLPVVDYCISVALLLLLKASTSNFTFLLILAAPVDRSGTSTTDFCNKAVDLATLSICYESKWKKEETLLFKTQPFCRVHSDEVIYLDVFLFIF